MSRRFLSYALVSATAFVGGWLVGRESVSERAPHRAVPGLDPPPRQSDVASADPIASARSLAAPPPDSTATRTDSIAPPNATPSKEVNQLPVKTQKQWRLELLEKDLAVLQGKQPLPFTNTRWGNAYLVVMQSIAAIMDAAGTSTDDAPPFMPRSERERYFGLRGRAYRFGVGEVPEFDAVQDYATRYSEYESRRIRDPSAVEPLLSPDVVDLIVSRAETALALLK